MLVSVKEAEYLEDYKIKLTFDDGKSGIVDLKQTIFNDHREIFKSLRDKSYFKSFQLDTWTLTWDNGVDLSPEFLYDLAVNQNSNQNAAAKKVLK